MSIPPIKQAPPSVFPSLICADLCNLERDARTFSELGYSALHIDIVDGYFSPSMPLGIETLRQLRKRTSLPFDAHVMAKDPDFFIEELLDIGVDRLCFQVETTHHIDRLLNRIKEAGARAGVALNPGTPLSVLDYIAGRCDYVLLMLINPGYAHSPREAQVPYALKKIIDLRQYFDKADLGIPIQLDGRISLENIRDYYKAGAGIFVAGSTCLFTNGDLGSGKEAIDKVIGNLASGRETSEKAIEAAIHAH